jgi:outer membrane receptor protein involved in Fe transport
VLQSEFDYSACTLNSGETYTCGGSATAVPGAFTLDFDDIDTIGADGELRDFDFATDVFNFGPTNYYQRPDERYTAGAFVDYELNDSAEVYGELMFMNDRSVSQIAPSGAFLGTGPYDINCDSPLLSQSMVDTWCGGVADDSLAQVFIGRRNVEGGGRQNDITHESFRIVAGVRGDITDLWSYDASLQHGTTNRSSTFLNDFSVARINNALSVDPVDPSVCLINADADPSNDDPECVPWNIFQPGGVTQEALDYLQVPGIIRAQATQRVLNANVTGDLSEYVRLPSAGGGLVVNVGAEYRHEETEFNPDLAFQTGDLAGQGAPTLPLAGQFHVRELFFEGRLPLIEGMTGVRALSFETGYRYSEYSTDFDTDTYKFGLDWEPIESLRFRGSFQHAVRAPNVGELFGSQLVALNGTSDPCAGEDPSATEEECARTGVLPGQYGNIAQNPANQYNGLVGGNPDLQPEEAETVSFGLVWQPEFAPNLSLAVDWFDIEVDDVISAGGLQDAFINDCLATGNEATCSLIHRDQFGSLWATPEGYVEDTSLNIGGLATTGFDVQAGYAFDAGAHHVALSLIGTVLDELSVQPLASGDSYDCAGFYGSTCGVPNPEWRHRLTTTWSTPWLGIDVTAAWRFYDSVDNQLASPDDLLSPGDAAPQATDAHFASRSYIDLTGAITFADRYTLRIGANNLLDKDPPLVGGDQCPTGPCNGNTFPQVYDTLGRQLFATFTMDF